MKRTLLFVLALAVTPVGVDAQVTELAQLRALAEQGLADAQYNLERLSDRGEGVPYYPAVLAGLLFLPA